MKGTNFLHTRDFLLARLGGAGLEQFLARRGEQDRQELGSVVAVGWYDLGLEVRLMRAIDREVGDGRGAILGELGEYHAEQDLTRVHRLFLRLANPAYVLEKSGEFWGRFYSTGAWQVERPTPQSARGTLSRFRADAVYCRFIASYVRRMFELVGARDVAVEHAACQYRGAPACVFVGRWS